VFRGRRGNLVKVLWHDSLGMSLYAKRLERGKCNRGKFPGGGGVRG
jgi:transposase